MTTPVQPTGEDTLNSIFHTLYKDAVGDDKLSKKEKNQSPNQVYQAGGHGGVVRTTPGFKPQLFLLIHFAQGLWRRKPLLPKYRSIRILDCFRWLIRYRPTYERSFPNSIKPARVSHKSTRYPSLILVESVTMEDLTHGYSKPCIMDVKMGTRTAGENANLLKKNYMISKDKATTTASLGLRIVAARVGFLPS